MSPNSSPAADAETFVQRIEEAQEYAQAAMAWSQQRMENDANRSRQAAETLKRGDKVWLNLRNINTPQLSKKLSWTQAKYTVEKQISPMVYELADLPSAIHNRFHVDLLRRAATDALPSQKTDDAQPPPLVPQTEENEAEFEVERILRAEKKRVGRGWVRQLLIKWKGYADPDWQPRSLFTEVQDLDRFEAKYGKGDGVGEDIGARTGARRSRAAAMNALEATTSWQKRCMAFVCSIVPPTLPSLVLYTR
jgi:hypothetical protein